MADFTGMTVKVTLNEPPNLVLQGKVKHVIAGQTLTLTDVYFPHNGLRTDLWTVRSSTMQDLAVVDTIAATIRTSTPATRTAVNGSQRQASDFVDPAILSYGRSPAQTKPAPKPAAEPSTPAKAVSQEPADTPLVAEAGQENNGTSKKKIRRGQKKRAAQTTTQTQEPLPVMNVEVSRNGNDMNGNGNGSVRKGKGWRQTPLLQPSPHNSSPHYSGSTRKTRREMDAAKEAQQNGWATEDASDVKDMGDFDFEANHKLFDKKQVFDELRQEDTTADEERLVSHNRLPARPGTYGGKSLHPTENVLSPQIAPTNVKYHSPRDINETMDSTSDADTELNFAPNGRSSSKHSTTRTSLKKQPSRQNSAQVEVKPHPLTASMSSDRGVGPMTRSVTSLSGRAAKGIPSITTSPRPERGQSPHSAISTTARTHASTVLPSHQETLEPHLAILPSLTPCPTLHPAALDTLEEATIERYGLSQEAITETAARCIAETALHLFHPHPVSRRGSRADTLRGSMNAADHLPMTIVVIAGNHSTGARAVAAARHLMSKGNEIILVEPQCDSTDTRDAQKRTQFRILKRMIRTSAKSNFKYGSWSKAFKYIKDLSAPPAVIIDALLASASYESLLDLSNTRHGTARQEEAREIIDWANRSRAPVLSIGCPSGVSGLDGTTTTVEGEPLAIRSNKLLCLAAPMQGVLEAMRRGERWDVNLADIGLNIALQSPTETIPFGAQWVTELRYIDSDELGLGIVGA